MISVATQIRIAQLVRDDFRSAEWYAKQGSFNWTDEDEQKHPRDDHGRWAHTMSRGEFHQQEKLKPGYDVSATNKTYWAAVKQAALEGKEVHLKADEEHRQIFGEAVPRGTPAKKSAEFLTGDAKAQHLAKLAKKAEAKGYLGASVTDVTPPGYGPGASEEPTPVLKTLDKHTESPIAAKLRDSIKKALVEDFGEKIGGARKDNAKPLGSRGKKADDTKDDRPAWARRYEINQVAKSSDKTEEGKWSITDTKDTSAWGIPRQKGVFTSKAEAEAALPLVAVSRNHRVNVISGNMTDDNREFGIVRNITDRKRATVKGGFKTEDEARRYMESNAAEIIEHQFPRYEDYAYLDHVERQGPDHPTPGGNVTPADFQKAFQFRGGEFGNWQSGKDGVTSLNHAYDALHDLSDALGLPAKSVALNGDLAIAFGARGTGGKNSARAHYEPDARVMNLTKMKGAGSLAHEWSHALDWHLGNGEHAVSDPSYKTKLRPEVAAAAKSLRDTMMTKTTTRAREGQREEKLRDTAKEGVERHLKQIEDSHAGMVGSSYFKRAKAFTPEQQKRWNALKTQVLAGDVGDRKYSDSGYSTFAPIEEMNALYKQATGRSFHTKDDHSPGRSLFWATQRLADSNQRVASVGEGAADTLRGKSDFLNESIDMDRTQVGNYYSLPHEMFARAFEAYVADKLHEKGIRSDYLVSHGKTDNRNYAIINQKPFPEGDERKAINAAFDNFFAALKHQSRSDDKGEHVQIYARERIAESLQRWIECYSLRSDIERAAASTDVMPSREQAEAGNYRKGRFRLWGKEIVIENPRGSTRSGCSRAGKCWSVLMPAHYGYIRQHVSEADGDHVDVYIGRHPESEVIFIVDQIDPESGLFDEWKVMIGFRSESEAKAVYLSAYTSKAKLRLGNVTAMTKADFLRWLDEPYQSQKIRTSRTARYSRIPSLAANEGALSESSKQEVRIVWGARNQSLRRLVEEFSNILGRHGTASERNDAGAKRYQRRLLSEELPLGDTSRPTSQQTMQSVLRTQRKAVNSIGLGERVRHSPSGPEVASQTLQLDNRESVDNPGWCAANQFTNADVSRQDTTNVRMGEGVGNQACNLKKPARKDGLECSEITDIPVCGTKSVVTYSRITDAVNQFARLGRVERYAKFDPEKHPRDSDGRWQRVFDRMNRPVAITHVSSERKPATRTDALRFAEQFKGKTFQNHDTGWPLHFYQDGASDTVYRRGIDYSVLSAIPTLAKRAVLFATEPEEKSPGKFKSVHHFFAPLNIDGEPHVAKLTVKERHDKKQALTEFRLYNVGHKKIGRLERSTADVGAEALPVSAQSKPSTVSIGRLVEAVKERYPEHVHEAHFRDNVATYAAQRGLFNESEHPRDEAGKFTLKDRIHEHLSKAGGPVKHRELLRAMGHTDVDPQNPQANPVNKALKEMRDAGEVEAHQPQWGEPSFSAKPKPPVAVPTKKESVFAQQQGLFDRGEFTTGQKSLFNVIAPDQPKSKTSKTADLFAGMAADVAAHLKGKETISPADRGIVVQADTLPGQREMFQRRGAVMRYEMPIPERPEWLKPKSAPRQPEQQQPSKSKPSKGGWQKVGGSSVFVNSAGRITKGCPGLKGHHVGELIDEDDESRDRRAAKQAHATARGLTGKDLSATAANKFASPRHVAQHQNALAAGKRMGVATTDVLAHMPGALESQAESIKLREAAKANARKLTGLNAGNLHKIEDTGHDHARTKGFDEAAMSFLYENPEMNFGGTEGNVDDIGDKLWDFIKEGKQAIPQLHHASIADEAANMVAASKVTRTRAMVARMTKDVSRKMAAVIEDDSFNFGANAAF